MEFELLTKRFVKTTKQLENTKFFHVENQTPIFTLSHVRSIIDYLKRI